MTLLFDRVGTMCWRVAATAAVLALVLVLHAASAQAEDRRIALVFGMSGYLNAAPLANPTNDARAISRKLTALGFEVDERIDADYRTMARALREFGMRVQTAETAIVYFAGHGMQVDQENYLIPVDARLERERDLLYEAMPLNLVLGEVAQARSLGLVILDACRNNPFTRKLLAGGRGQRIQQGLARVDSPPKDTLVALATRADAVAEDGEGANSPYTAALLRQLDERGLELGLFFRRVRDDVLAQTGGRQEPYTFGSLSAVAFYFNPQPANRPPVVLPVAPMEIADNAGPVPLALGDISDPDPGQRLTARLTSIPKGGELRLGDRVLLLGDVLTLEQFAKSAFTPDGSHVGYAGAVGFVVEDGAGAAVPGSIFIKVVASNHPPTLSGPQMVLAVPLGLQVPVDPDGDPLHVIVTAVPGRGAIRNGGRLLKVGDRFDAGQLAALVFDPGDAPPGEAGSFDFRVEDGRGGQASSSVALMVAGRGQPAPWPTADPAPGPQLAAIVPVPAPNPEPPPPRLAEVVVRAAPPPPPGPEPAPPTPSGEGIKDCAACPVLVPIKPGSFMMGSADGDASERPPRRVSVDAGFALGKYEVTSGEWAACVAAGACKPASSADPNPNLPARDLSWRDAQDYVAWLSKLTGKRYRLPSEAEWEYAARSGTTGAYWWGGQIAGKANCSDCGGSHDRAMPAPVGSFAANPFGLHDMNGGVAEWVADCWFPSHAGAPKNAGARDSKRCNNRVLKGGSWLNDRSYLTAAARLPYDAAVRYLGNGFRVARDLP